MGRWAGGAQGKPDSKAQPATGPSPVALLVHVSAPVTLWLHVSAAGNEGIRLPTSHFHRCIRASHTACARREACCLTEAAPRKSLDLGGRNG